MSQKKIWTTSYLHYIKTGAGDIGNYSECSFTTSGTGTFLPNDEASPHIGEANKNEKVNEERIELIFPRFKEGEIITCLRNAHPYEEVAYYVTQLTNANQEVGSGMVGELTESMEPFAFFKLFKR